MVSYLQSEGITKEVLQPGQQQQSFSIEDPSIARMHKVSAGRLDPYLQGEIEMNPKDVGDDHVVDIDYELWRFVRYIDNIYTILHNTKEFDIVTHNILIGS